MEGIHDHWWIPTGVVISDCLHLKFFTSIMLRSWGLHKVQFLLVQPYKHSTWFTFVITSIYLSRKRYLKNILWIIQNLRGLFYIPYLMSNLLWKIARFIVGSYHLPKWCGRNKVEATFKTIPVIGTLKEIKKRYFFLVGPAISHTMALQNEWAAVPKGNFLCSRRLTAEIMEPFRNVFFYVTNIKTVGWQSLFRYVIDKEIFHPQDHFWAQLKMFVNLIWKATLRLKVCQCWCIA